MCDSVNNVGMPVLRPDLRQPCIELRGFVQPHCLVTACHNSDFIVPPQPENWGHWQHGPRSYSVTLPEFEPPPFRMGS